MVAQRLPTRCGEHARKIEGRQTGFPVSGPAGYAVACSTGKKPWGLTTTIAENWWDHIEGWGVYTACEVFWMRRDTGSGRFPIEYTWPEPKMPLPLERSIVHGSGCCRVRQRLIDNPAGEGRVWTRILVTLSLLAVLRLVALLSLPGTDISSLDSLGGSSG